MGGIAVANTVTLSATVSEPNTRHRVLLDVEVAPIGQAFTGRPTASSPLGPSGVTATVTVGPLAQNVGYHWQARARDDAGGMSAWVSFPEAPGNAETDADFTYRSQPPPAQLVFSGQPSTAHIKKPLYPPVVITALDANGQTSIGFTGVVTITLATNLTGAHLLGTTSVSAVGGVAWFSNLMIDKPGFGYALRATTTQPPLSAVSTPLTVQK